VHNAAAKYQIDMPITDMLYQLVRNELAASDVMERLMQREPKSE
jgi:glycerol-3-phosphate dehydrogenase [NAD(P)+]